MNYKGHKSTSLLILGISLIPLKQNPLFSFNYSNPFILHYQEQLTKVVNYLTVDLYIFIASFIAFWIGSTIIDTIDFKILKKLINVDNLPSYDIEKDRNRDGKIVYEPKHYLYHRQITHSVLLHLILFMGSFFFLGSNSYVIILFMFSFGIWTHLIMDFFTGSIPLLFKAPYYKKFHRIGITTFLPKFMHKGFTKFLPAIMDRKKLYIPIGSLGLVLIISAFFNLLPF
jgi:hypothetical protein